MELSEAGRARAMELREIFRAKNISKIYSSAVLRCRQTAEIVADGQIPVVYDQRLLESLSAYQGYWVHDFDEFFAYHDELGGETVLDIQTRVVNFYEELIASLTDNENVVICSHADPLHVLFAHLRHIPLSTDQHLPETIDFGWLQRGEFLEL